MKQKFHLAVIIVALLILACDGVAQAQGNSGRHRAKPVVKSGGAVKTPSGLIYLIAKKGTGRRPRVGETVVVHYTGTFTNGAKFDSSHDGGEPISFPLGRGRVIKGWDEGIGKLRVGDHAIFVIPSAIAYGPKGRGPIPPNATLLFVVELVDIKPN